MANIIQEIEKEHKRGLIQIGFLSDAINRIQNDASFDFEINLMRKILVPLIEDVKDHTEKEEVNIFPSIMINKINAKLVAELVIEHNCLLENMYELKKFLISNKDIKSNKEIQTIKDKLKTVIDIFLNHIRREEKDLFPLVEKL